MAASPDAASITRTGPTRCATKSRCPVSAEGNSQWIMEYGFERRYMPALIASASEAVRVVESEYRR